MKKYEHNKKTKKTNVTLENFKKIINPLSAKFGRRGNVFIEITWQDKKLSLHGVEGPLHNGNALGGAGQMYQPLDEYDEPKLKEGWTKEKYNMLLTIWKEYHLNDMQPDCEHQRAMGWGDILLDESKPKTQDNMAGWTYPKEHPKGVLGKECPVCGYKYGSKWLTKEVPVEALEFLYNLPDTTIEPAWV